MKRAGRKVEIDMHAKGIDQHMIDLALATGMPVKVSPKFWAEHMGMPYHQADIREPERPARRPPRQRADGAQRRVAQLHPLRLCRPDARRPRATTSCGASGRARSGCCCGRDPVFAAGYARAFQFCGSCGVEVMEPLSFKGRRGSGIAGRADRTS